VFVAGWAREASSGLVGVARKDGENGAQAILQYLQTAQPLKDPDKVRENLHLRLSILDKPVVIKEHLKLLEQVEQDRAQLLGQEEFKFATNDEMLEAMGLAEPI
jgi:ferredoxin--NADP+ reductase